MNPEISIYIPTHNRIELLKRAVNSCLHQNFKNFELIIVNDASSDGTFEYLELLSNRNEKVKVLHNESQIGAPASRNKAINIAQGKYITGLDDDDYFLQGRLVHLINSYKSRYSFVCTNFRCKPWYSVHQIIQKSGDLKLDDLLLRNASSNQIFTTLKRVKQIGGFDEELEACQDTDLCTRLILEYGSAYRLRKRTYVVDFDEAPNRISESKRTYIGYYQFYLKYRNLMNRQQRSYRLLLIRKAQQKKIGLNIFRALIVDLGILDIFKQSVWWLLKNKLALF